MVYEKYIKKNGRLYGPYIYHSRRVDDKVISEYYGHQKKRNYKKIFIFSSFILLFIMALYGFNLLKPYISGRAIFNLDANYQEGKQLEGVLKLSLKQGELIPSSAKLILDNNGNLMEYPLKEVLSGQTAQQGVFYVSGKNISGEGEGYGFIGEKDVQPIVYFTLNVFNNQSKEVSAASGEVSSTGGTSEIIPEETNLSVEQNITPQNISGEENQTELSNGTIEPMPSEISNSSEVINATSETTSPVQEIPSEEASSPIEIIPSQEPLDEILSAETTSATGSDTKKEEKKEDVESTVPIPSAENSIEIEKEDKKEETKSKDSSSETTPAPSESSSITGNIISTLFGGIANFFLSLTGTGKVTAEIGKNIEANVSAGNHFIYGLQKGEAAKLKKDSVYLIDSDGKKQKLEDSVISADVSNGKMIVTTDYSRKEQGFGEEYIGSKEEELAINLSSLGIMLEKGNLSITLSYQEENLILLSTAIDSGEIVTNETDLDILINISNQTNYNQTNETINPLIEFVSSSELTSEERENLSLYLGNYSISTTKSELFNGRLIRNYKLGDYEVEYSYEYAGEISPRLEEQMQGDLMKWLRDILREVSRNKSASEKIDSLLGNYTFRNITTNGSMPEEANDTQEILNVNESLNVYGNVTNETILENSSSNLFENSTA